MNRKLLACFLILLLLCTACGRTESLSTEVPILTEAPLLTVSAGDAALEVSYGTSSWSYDLGNGQATGYEACGIHPLDGQEHWKNLGVTSTTATLNFGAIPPDSITVQCWRTEYWGNYDAPAEKIALQNSTFQLKDGSYVYEVCAKWSSAEAYGGNAYYTFVAE